METTAIQQADGAPGRAIALERIVEIAPAFDRRHPDPAKNYGIHGVEMRFVLKGDRGAVQFVIYTNWHLPDVAKELWAKAGQGPYNPFAPIGADVGYHSPVPQYEGQEPMGSDPCPYLDGKPCFYDGSGLAADGLLKLMIGEGGDAMWAKLEARYERLSGKAEPRTLASDLVEDR